MTTNLRQNPQTVIKSGVDNLIMKPRTQGWGEDYRTVSAMSGLLAALCGLVGKLGLDSGATSISYLDSKALEAILRLLLVLATLLLNGAMVTLYTKALSLAGVAAEASLINTASNLCFTAIFSFVIFKEKFSFQWILGLVLVFVGVTLTMADEKSKDVKKDE